MKKVFIFAVLTVTSTLFLCQTLSAQNPMREARQEERQQANAQANAALTSDVKSQNLMFLAQEITQTMNPNMQNIQLYQIWAIWVSPQQFRVYLPIYGSGGYTGQPTLLRKMDFTTSNFTYSSQPANYGGYNITITAQDTWSLTNYTFFLQVPASGNNSTLTISSDFQPSVTFTGIVQPNNLSSASN